MAAVHGRRGTVTVGGNTVLMVSSFSYDASADETDVTAMGDTSKKYLTGLQDGSGSIECRLAQTDFAAGDGQGDLYFEFASGGTISLDLIIDDTTAGAKDIYGLSGTTSVINGWSLNQSFDDAVNITFSFRGALAPYTGTN